MAKKDKQLLTLGLIVLGAFLIFRKKANAAPPIVAPGPESTLPLTRPVVILEKPVISPRVSGYFPSRLPGARPEMPYGVRWGSGEQFQDTTRKANMVL